MAVPPLKNDFSIISNAKGRSDGILAATWRTGVRSMSTGSCAEQAAFGSDFRMRRPVLSLAIASWNPSPLIDPTAFRLPTSHVLCDSDFIGIHCHGSTCVVSAYGPLPTAVTQEPCFAGTVKRNQHIPGNCAYFYPKMMN
jgi:hypothetical protein